MQSTADALMLVVARKESTARAMSFAVARNEYAEKARSAAHTATGQSARESGDT
jgi:hypothetical protein